MEIKTDWTPDDYFNIDAELTRIEGNIHAVLLTIQAAGYAPELDEKLAWTQYDFPTAAQLNRMVENIEALEQVIAMPDGLPALPFFDQYMGADDVNAIERHIQALGQVATGMVQSFVRSGTMQAGQRPVLLT